MKISDKLLKKYALGTPILPPPSGDLVEEVVIPTTKVPIIQEHLSEEEMQDWEDFIERKKLDKKLEHFRDVSLKDKGPDIGEELKAPKEEGTLPAIPGKKHANLSPDALLKMCSKYHDLCHKF